MTLPIPSYVTPFESIARTLITAATLTLIWTGASRMEVRTAARYPLAGLLSAALIAWVVLAQHLGAANTYLALSDDQPQSVALPLALLLPLTVTVGAIWMSQPLARLVSAIPLWSLVAIQFYRVAGGIFIILWASDRLALAIRTSGVMGGKPFDAHLRFADLWGKPAGRWQVVFTQVTQVPSQK